MRVLEYLWRDYKLPSGEPQPANLRQSDSRDRPTPGRALGSRRSAPAASGRQPAHSVPGASGSVRLAFLSIIFEAAGLPEQYAPARLGDLTSRSRASSTRYAAPWRQPARTFTTSCATSTSPRCSPQALIEAGATFGDSASRGEHHAAEPVPDRSTDVSNEEMLDAFERGSPACRARPTASCPSRSSCSTRCSSTSTTTTLRLEHVQHIVEGCSARFDSQVLVVATGQAR